MKSATTFFIVLVLLHSTAEAKPHAPKHFVCSEKVYVMLKSLCKVSGHSDYLLTSAASCCHTNCELLEMEAMCLEAKEQQVVDTSEE